MNVHIHAPDVLTQLHKKIILILISRRMVVDSTEVLAGGLQVVPVAVVVPFLITTMLLLQLIFPILVIIMIKQGPKLIIQIIKFYKTHLIATQLILTKIVHLILIYQVMVLQNSTKLEILRRNLLKILLLIVLTIDNHLMNQIVNFYLILNSHHFLLILKIVLII